MHALTQGPMSIRWLASQMYTLIQMQVVDWGFDPKLFKTVRLSRRQPYRHMLAVRYHSAGICAGGASTPGRFKRDMPQRRCRHLWIMQRMLGEQLRKKSNPMDPSHSRFPFHCWNPFFFQRSEKDKDRSNASFICKRWSPSSFTVRARAYVCSSIVLHGLEREKKRCHCKWKYTEGFGIVRCYLIGIMFHLCCFIST